MFYGLLNFYLYTMSFVYSPARNALYGKYFLVFMKLAFLIRFAISILLKTQPRYAISSPLQCPFLQILFSKIIHRCRWLMILMKKFTGLFYFFFQYLGAVFFRTVRSHSYTSMWWLLLKAAFHKDCLSLRVFHTCLHTRRT